MHGDPTRKFRIIADIIQTVSDRDWESSGIANALAATGALRRSEIESLTVLATRFGFLKDARGTISATQEGRAFRRYMSDLDSRVETWNSPPLEQAIESQICATLPPRWGSELKELFGEKLQTTSEGIKMVVSDATTKLVAVTPYLDVQILQMCLADTYAKQVDFSLITSDERLRKEYPSGRNYTKEKLSKLISTRFHGGKVFHFENGQSIAHSKVWSSERSVFITSANLQSDSITDNFEVGLYTDEPDVVQTIRALLEKVARMEELICILRVP